MRIREGLRRGGGVAITLISDSPFTLTKLDIDDFENDSPLEVCWGIVKPRQPTGQIKSIIVCSFYCPPRSRKKTDLLNHITTNYFILKSKYPDSGFICGGDRNDLNTQLLLDIDPSFKQLVTMPIYKQSILDIIVTDLGHYYLDPTTRSPVQPEDPATTCPSDHNIVIVKTNTSTL